ncbi:hypothetical protein HDU76_002648, partial [Blyttiomyces sp. JEL0837]
MLWSLLLVAVSWVSVAQCAPISVNQQSKTIATLPVRFFQHSTTKVLDKRFFDDKCPTCAPAENICDETTDCIDTEGYGTMCVCRPGFKATHDDSSTIQWRIKWPVPGHEHRVFVLPGHVCEQLCSVDHVGQDVCEETTTISKTSTTTLSTVIDAITNKATLSSRLEVSATKFNTQNSVEDTWTPEETAQFPSTISKPHSMSSTMITETAETKYPVLSSREITVTTDHGNTDDSQTTSQPLTPTKIIGSLSQTENNAVASTIINSLSSDFVGRFTHKTSEQPTSTTTLIDQSTPVPTVSSSIGTDSSESEISKPTREISELEPGALPPTMTSEILSHEPNLTATSTKSYNGHESTVASEATGEASKLHSKARIAISSAKATTRSNSMHLTSAELATNGNSEVSTLAQTLRISSEPSLSSSQYSILTLEVTTETATRTNNLSTEIHSITVTLSNVTNTGTPHAISSTQETLHSSGALGVSSLKSTFEPVAPTQTRVSETTYSFTPSFTFTTNPMTPETTHPATELITFYSETDTVETGTGIPIQTQPNFSTEFIETATVITETGIPISRTETRDSTLESSTMEGTVTTFMFGTTSTLASIDSKVTKSPDTSSTKVEIMPTTLGTETFLTTMNVSSSFTSIETTLVDKSFETYITEVATEFTNVPLSSSYDNDVTYTKSEASMSSQNADEASSSMMPLSSDTNIETLATEVASDIYSHKSTSMLTSADYLQKVTTFSVSSETKKPMTESFSSSVSWTNSMDTNLESQATVIATETVTKPTESSSTIVTSAGSSVGSFVPQLTQVTDTTAEVTVTEVAFPVSNSTYETHESSTLSGSVEGSASEIATDVASPVTTILTHLSEIGESARVQTGTQSSELSRATTIAPSTTEQILTTAMQSQVTLTTLAAISGTSSISSWAIPPTLKPSATFGLESEATVIPTVKETESQFTFSIAEKSLSPSSTLVGTSESTITPKSTMLGSFISTTTGTRDSQNGTETALTTTTSVQPVTFSSVVTSEPGLLSTENGISSATQTSRPTSATEESATSSEKTSEFTESFDIMSRSTLETLPNTDVLQTSTKPSVSLATETAYETTSTLAGQNYSLSETVLTPTTISVFTASKTVPSSMFTASTETRMQYTIPVVTPTLIATATQIEQWTSRGPSSSADTILETTGETRHVQTPVTSEQSSMHHNNGTELLPTNVITSESRSVVLQSSTFFSSSISSDNFMNTFPISENATKIVTTTSSLIFSSLPIAVPTQIWISTTTSPSSKPLFETSSETAMPKTESTVLSGVTTTALSSIETESQAHSTIQINTLSETLLRSETASLSHHSAKSMPANSFSASSEITSEVSPTTMPEGITQSTNTLETSSTFTGENSQFASQTNTFEPTQPMTTTSEGITQSMDAVETSLTSTIENSQFTNTTTTLKPTKLMTTTPEGTTTTEEISLASTIENSQTANPTTSVKPTNVMTTTSDVITQSITTEETPFSTIENSQMSNATTTLKPTKTIPEPNTTVNNTNTLTNTIETTATEEPTNTLETSTEEPIFIPIPTGFTDEPKQTQTPTTQIPPGPTIFSSCSNCYTDSQALSLGLFTGTPCAKQSVSPLTYYANEADTALSIQCVDVGVLGPMCRCPKGYKGSQDDEDVERHWRVSGLRG